MLHGSYVFQGSFILILRRDYMSNSRFQYPNSKSMTNTYFSTSDYKNVLYIVDDCGEKKSINTILCHEITTWGPLLSNELETFSQEIRHIVGNDAMEFIKNGKVPSNIKVEYASMVCDQQPLNNRKSELD